MKDCQKIAIIAVLLVVALVPLSQSDPNTSLQKAVYLKKVLEYCGGDSWHTDQGYRSLRDSFVEQEVFAQQSDFDDVVTEIEAWLLDRQGAEFSIWCDSKTAGARKFFIDQWSNEMDAGLDELITNLLD